MRVLVAPDTFGGTLTAGEAADAIRTGWLRHTPDDAVATAPMSDGGPGFCGVVHRAAGGELSAMTVSGPYGEELPATVLIVGETAYVETAQACGLELVPADRRDAEVASSYGAGQLIAAGLEAGAKRLVVGLGGTGTNDAGAGLLAALGARADPDGALLGGPAGLATLTAIDIAPVREKVAGVELIAIGDVDNPLLGLRGATNVFGARKGIAQERLSTVDSALARLAEQTSPATADLRGAGAAGGIGFALLALGARREPAMDLVAGIVGLETLAREVDLIITGEGVFDVQSRAGTVPHGVAQVAQGALRPCIVLAGAVHIGAREMRTIGIEAAYSVVALVGRDAALADPAGSLAALAERVARTWSH
jgi:glycerate kinase